MSVYQTICVIINCNNFFPFSHLIKIDLIRAFVNSANGLFGFQVLAYLHILHLSRGIR